MLFFSFTKIARVRGPNAAVEQAEQQGKQDINDKKL